MKIKWPWARSQNGDAPAVDPEPPLTREYLRQLTEKLDRQEAKLSELRNDFVGLLEEWSNGREVFVEKMKKRFEDEYQKLAFDVEQAQDLLAKYRRECDSLKDENTVQANTIAAMQASHNAMVERWRAEAAVQTAKRTFSQPGAVEES